MYGDHIGDAMSCHKEGKKVVGISNPRLFYPKYLSFLSCLFYI